MTFDFDKAIAFLKSIATWDAQMLALLQKTIASGDLLTVFPALAPIEKEVEVVLNLFLKIEALVESFFPPATP